MAPRLQAFTQMEMILLSRSSERLSLMISQLMHIGSVRALVERLANLDFAEMAGYRDRNIRG